MATAVLIRFVLMIPALSNGDMVVSIYVSSVLQSVLAIALPAFLVTAMTHPSPLQYLKIEKSRKMTEDVFFALLLFLVSFLFASFLSQWNRGLVLPQSMSGVEEVMRSMEDAALETTHLLLSVDTIGGLLLNLVIVAGLAAVSEELFFRGALQQFMLEKFRSRHAAVWVASLIFSLVHFQFYGFLPRLFLGALLGYLFLYTGNLWIPIFFHFINNATVLVMNYLWRDAGWFRNLNDLSITLPFVAGALVSALLTFLLFSKFYKKRSIHIDDSSHSKII